MDLVQALGKLNAQAIIRQSAYGFYFMEHTVNSLFEGRKRLEPVRLPHLKKHGRVEEPRP